MLGRDRRGNVAWWAPGAPPAAPAGAGALGGAHRWGQRVHHG